jgi:hypothetical protein
MEMGHEAHRKLECCDKDITERESFPCSPFLLSHIPQSLAKEGAQDSERTPDMKEQSNEHDEV